MTDLIWNITNGTGMYRRIRYERGLVGRIGRGKTGRHEEEGGVCYPLESGATVATFGRGRCLLDLVEGEHTTWSLDLANLVGLGGVRMTTTVLETLNHDKLQHSYN